MRQCSLLVLLGLLLVADVEAADIRLARSLSGAPLPGITIEGAIAPGDYQKLVALALSSKGSHTVWLASPRRKPGRGAPHGAVHPRPRIRSIGAVQQGRATGSPEESRQQYLLQFLLPALRRRRQPPRHSARAASSVTAGRRVFLLGLDGAVEAYRVIRDAVTGYLEEMGVPSRYTSLMLSTANSDMVWLSSEDIRTDLDGVVAEYAERFRDVCPRRTRPENGEYYRPVQVFSPAERLTEKGDVDCVSARLQEMQEERRQIAVARLRQERQ